MTSFIEQFKGYVSKKGLFNKSDKLLVAISGGCDSIALTHLLLQLEYSVSLAHCNFQLRGEDSDEDELFVNEFANQNQCQLFSKRFDTFKYATSRKISIEEAARNLRYGWFEELLKENGFDYIVTGHHLDDAIETFFINLTAGTGIRGLQGIPSKNKHIVRPLLFADRDSILKYCSVYKLDYRTDRSNFDTKFIRNRIRHNIIPQFKEINPSFIETMSGNIGIYTEFFRIYTKSLDDAIRKVTVSSNKLIYIDFKRVLEYEAPVSLLYELISPYGFNSSQIKEMIHNGAKMQTGSQFHSPDYRIVKHGQHLILGAKAPKDNCVEVNQDDIGVEPKGGLIFNYFDHSETIDFSNKNHAYIDAEKLTFPLFIRQAAAGDYFIPFGMKGRKMISDYFTDLKLNIFEKESTRLLVSDGKIIWVIGHRIDERYKIEPSTTKILHVIKD